MPNLSKRNSRKRNRMPLLFSGWTSSGRAAKGLISSSRTLKMNSGCCEGQTRQVRALVAMYDAYNAAAEAMMGIENQPRSEGACLLEDECAWLKLRAKAVAVQLARMRPSDYDQSGLSKRSSTPRSKRATISMARTRSSEPAAMAVGTAK